MDQFHLAFNFPDLSGKNKPFFSHHLNVLFFGKVPKDPKVSALVNNYIRLTEAAILQYENGRQLALKYFNTSSSIAVGALFSSSAEFEACIANVHRAIKHMNKLKNRPDVPADIKSALPARVKFIEKGIADRIADIRHEIQHIEEHLLDGKVDVGSGEATFLHLDGTTSPTSDGSVKTYDRLKIGKINISFDDLVSWLNEMWDCANKLTEHCAKDIPKT